MVFNGIIKKLRLIKDLQYIIGVGFKLVLRVLDGTFQCTQKKHNFNSSLPNGTIPLIKVICQLTNIQSLSIRSTDIDDIKGVAGLKRLHHLDVSYTNVATLVPLHGLPLHTLVINATRVTDLTPVCSLQLRRLDISKLTIHNLTPLTRLESLTEVKMNWVKDVNNTINETLKQLKLRTLQVSGVYWFRLDACPNIVSLTANVNHLSNCLPLQQYNHIQALSLSNSSVESLTPFKHLTTLLELNLNDNRVSDISCLAHLNVKKLIISQTKVKNINAIAKMDLEYLDVRWTAIDRLDPLDNQHNLRYLDVEHTNVSDLLPLKHLSLQKLIANNTQITTLLPLIHHSQLTVLHAMHTCIQPSHAAVLNHLSNLSILLDYGC